MFRTDVHMGDNGKLKATVDQNSIDTRKPLPKVEATNLLTSSAHGESWLQKGGENDALRSLSRAQGEIAGSFARLTEWRGKQSPHLTQAQHLDTVAREYERNTRAHANRVDMATEHANAELKNLDAQARQAVGWTEDNAQELRSVVRSMDPGERSEFIGQAIENGDGSALGPVLSGHPALSGLTGEQQQAYQRAYKAKHTPKLLATEDAIKEAKGKVRAAFVEFLEAGDTVTAKEVREQYEQEAQEAAEARQRAAGVGDPTDRWDMFTS